MHEKLPIMQRVNVGEGDITGKPDWGMIQIGSYANFLDYKFINLIFLIFQA